MPTTTIRLDDALKSRLAIAARKAGKTPHGFILDAIAATVEQAEWDEAFHGVADERWARLLTTGETLPWDATKAWLEARSHGENLPRPKAHKPTR